MSTRVNQSVYSTPTLITYGDVREITQAVGNMGNDDGGAGATSKTQP